MHEKDKKYEILYPKPINRLGNKGIPVQCQKKKITEGKKGQLPEQKRPDQSSLALFMVYSKQFLIIGPQGIPGNTFHVALRIMYTDEHFLDQLYNQQLMNSAFVGYEELSRSRRVLSTSAKLSSCCFCHVFSYYFAQFQLQFLVLKQVKCLPFFSQPKQLNLVPRSSR